jgi:hypothetical protein
VTSTWQEKPGFKVAISSMSVHPVEHSVLIYWHRQGQWGQMLWPKFSWFYGLSYLQQWSGQPNLGGTPNYIHALFYRESPRSQNLKERTSSCFKGKRVTEKHSLSSVWTQYLSTGSVSPATKVLPLHAQETIHRQWG